MASLNQMTLIGNLGQDPKVTRFQGSGISASFTVATTERGYQKQDGTKTEDQTEWHNVVLFGKLAEIAEKYLHKGSCVFIQGKLKTRSYDGKDGGKRYITEIIGHTMQLLDSKEKSQQSANYAPNQQVYPNSMQLQPQQQQYYPNNGGGYYPGNSGFGQHPGF